MQSCNCTHWYLPKEVENVCPHKNLYTNVCSSFIHIQVAKTWKQPRYSLIGKCISKLWYIQTMEYYLALKRNKLSS